MEKEILELVQKFADLKFQKKEFIPGSTYIPPSGKKIDAEEITMMTEAVLDGWLTTGRFNKEFEQKLGKFLDVKHVLTVNSGSSANLVAFTTLTSEKLGDRRIKHGDEVITVAAGFPTTVNPIIQNGAIPVFIDVDIHTHNIDVELIKSAITPKTKAIMVAHALGNPYDAEKIAEICRENKLWFIEDSCDALGAEVRGKKVGTYGDIGTLSFYPAHHITMGEGGAVFMNSDELKMIAESYRDWGRDCYCSTGCDNTCGKRFEQQFGKLPFGYDHKYVYSHCGYNLKITDMQAACGLAQLKKLGDFISKRKSNYNYLLNGLKDLKDYFYFTKVLDNCEPSWFGFPLTIKPSQDVNRVDLIKYLESNKIGTRLLFAGDLTKQPYFQHLSYRVVGELPNTELTMKNTFWIGVQPSLDKEELDYIIEKFLEYFGFGF